MARQGDRTFKITGQAGQWWHMPLIPALGRQRQVNFLVQGQPGLQSEFQDSQGYTEKPCLIKPKKKKKKKDSWSRNTGTRRESSMRSARDRPCHGGAGGWGGHNIGARGKRPHGRAA
jgi:hypothetical protein